MKPKQSRDIEPLPQQATKREPLPKAFPRLGELEGGLTDRFAQPELTVLQYN